VRRRNWRILFGEYQTNLFVANNNSMK
jgi:hypothetical protein